MAAGSIMVDWQPQHAMLFGRQPLRLKHSLHRSELFSDASLARLLEKVDRADYHVNTRSSGADGKLKRREGEFAGRSGEDILKAVANGDIWINLRAPQKVDPAYGELLEAIYTEFETRVPGLKTFRHIITILISSPKVYVPYHCDVPGQMLWQIRGTKRVWLYPAEPPFLPQPALEKLILGEMHETDMPYHAWFDDHSQAIDLTPGEMLHWPLNWPHRVENHDCLNVSVTTEHYTAPVRSSYAVNYANGLLRKSGMKTLKRQNEGPLMMAKMALAAGVKFSGVRKAAEKAYTIDFAVDPAMPSGVRDIAPHQLRK